MTRDKARELLLADVPLTCGTWTWDKWTRSCWSEDNCCFDSFKDIEAVLDDIEHYTDYKDLEPV